MTSWEPQNAVPAVALRTGLGVATVLSIGILAGHPAWIFAASMGAWTGGTSMLSKGVRPHPYLPLMAGSGFATALLLGGVTAPYPALTLVVTAVWALLMALIGSLGHALGPVTTVCGVALVIGPHLAAHNPPWVTAAAAFAGASVQMLIALVPLGPRYQPDRRILAEALREQATDARELADAMNTPLTTDALTRASEHLSGRRKLPEALRDSVGAMYEIRASIIAVAAARARLLENDRTAARQTGAVLRHVSEALDELADSVERVNPVREGWEDRIASAVDAAPDDDTEIGRSRHTIAGQETRRLYRAVYQLARLTERIVATEPATTVVARRVRMRSRLEEDWETLRSRLTTRSPAMRHAIRSSALIVLATGVAMLWPDQHGYWIALTAWVVLKADFAATLGGGVARMLGTAAGVVLASVIAGQLPSQSLAAAAAIASFALVGYFVMPVSYVVFCAAVAGFSVFQIDLTGDSAVHAAAERGFATLVGGVLAIVLYSAWPTWETRRLPELLADLVDAYRGYADVVLDMQARPAERSQEQLREAIDEIRIKRSTLTVAIEKAAAEPVAGPQPHSEDARDVADALSRAARALIVLEGAVRDWDAAQLPGVDEFSETVSRAYTALGEHILGGHPDPVDLRAALDDFDGVLNEGTLGTARRRRLLDWESDFIVDGLEDATHLVRDWKKTTEQS